jgi:ketosteroid isomerase-like protein
VSDTGALVGSEHEQIVRAWADAFNARDMDAVFEIVHPEVELVDLERTGRTWHGHDDYIEFVDEWLENFDAYSLELDELEEGPDGTFVRGRQRGRGAGSGLEFELPIHLAVRFRDGKVTYYRIAERDVARAEVGLD